MDRDELVAKIADMLYQRGMGSGKVGCRIAAEDLVAWMKAQDVLKLEKKEAANG